MPNASTDTLDLPNQEPYEKHLVFMVNNMAVMRREGIFTDVILCCADGVEVEGHRVVLAASSPFFRSLLSSTNAEDLERGTRKIIAHLPSQLQSSSVINVIQFIYTGRITMPTNAENVKGANQLRELLATSQFLQIHAFNKQLASLLVQSLTMENYSCVWDLADKYDVAPLKYEVIRYVGENFDKFIVRPEFVYFKADRIRMLMMNRAVAQNSPNKMLQALIVWLKYNSEAREKELPSLLRYVKFSKMSKPFLKSLIDTEPLVQQSYTLWCHIAATLYSRGCHLRNYDPERDNISQTETKLGSDLDEDAIRTKDLLPPEPIVTVPSVPSVSKEKLVSVPAQRQAISLKITPPVRKSCKQYMEQSQKWHLEKTTAKSLSAEEFKPLKVSATREKSKEQLSASTKSPISKSPFSTIERELEGRKPQLTKKLSS